MIKIIQKRHIEYSVDDTFSLPVREAYEGFFSENSQLVFIVAKNEQESFLIEKTFDINEDRTFLVTLNETEKKRLTPGDYIYKIRIIENNRASTEKSGDFIVKWGA